MEYYRLQHYAHGLAISSPPLVYGLFILSCLVRCSVSSSSRPVISLLTPPPLQGNSGDHMALLAFRSSMAADPFGALSSWNGSSHFCLWRGVVCGSRRHPDRVTKLVLSSLGLSGPIHTSIANLTFLRRLDLFNNSFYGHIPEELGHLRRLRHLRLRRNSLEGEIPAGLGHCSNLQNINLRDNSLRGTIPPWLGNLSSLQLLDLSENSLTGNIPPQLGTLTTLWGIAVQDNNLTGSIPCSLANLTTLDSLSLNGNSLSGAIPPTMGELKSLTWFTVETNRLTGTVPSSVYNLSSLVGLGLADNQLSGTLPPNLGISLPNLQVISMSKNQFYGPIPFSFKNASSLRIIQLNSNAFNGILPSEWGTLKNLTRLRLGGNQLEAKNDDDWSFITSLANCTRLQRLILGGNKLGGVLPPSISNLSRDLSVLALQSNHISGNIPEGIGGLVSLTILALGDNLFGGSIPTSLGKLHNLGYLSMRSSQLSGQIPSFMSNLTQLVMFSVGQNQLSGAIPSGLVNLQMLEVLDLSHNNLSGRIPKELLSISVLTELYLSSNSLSGVLPTEVHHLKNLNKMDISENKISGDIPSALGDCETLVYLHIGGNEFQGLIPQSFNNLRGLESLDVSRNNLSGNIPKFLQNFPYLNHLNLSFNNFDGEAPKDGIFQNASAMSILGNPKLCGGIPQLRLQPCSREESKRSQRHIPLAIIITIPGAILCMIILTLSVLCWSKRKTSPPVFHINEMFARITYAELFKATEGFSSSNLIGTGSFGSVYKGKMDPAEPVSKIVAVKVINLHQQGASKSFMTECEALKNIRHRNLLKILTSCSSLDFNGNDFKALVFEFMQNGSLEQWLHPVENENCEKDLSLAQRLNIAVDVAFAVSYLHSHNSSPIVHCDLKPSNVLLDDTMTAHVSDFGLAKFLSNKDDSKCSTSSLALRGSIGYVAPEYGMGCNASTEGDVYSYGILLLEMVTGRRPTDVLFSNDLTLHKFVQMAFPDHILDIVDRRLLWEDQVNAYGTSQRMRNLMEGRLACLVSMVGLGLTCSRESPRERMQMEDVAKEMTAIRERFLGAGTHGRMIDFTLGSNVASSSGIYGLQ